MSVDFTILPLGYFGNPLINECVFLTMAYELPFLPLTNFFNYFLIFIFLITLNYFSIFIFLTIFQFFLPNSVASTLPLWEIK